MNIKSLFAIALLAFSSMNAYADEFLNADKIKALITGNTIEAKHLLKGFKFKVYFDNDGKTALRNQKGNSQKTSYSFERNLHCIYWAGKDRCANIKDNGDGTYTRVMSNGKKVVKWTKITKGKTL